MTSQAHAVSLEAGSPVADTAAVQTPSLLHRFLLFPIKFLCGMVFCQSLAGSIFVVGWTYRLA